MSTEGIVAGTLGVKNEGWFDPWSYLVALKKKCVSLNVEFIQGDVKDFKRKVDNRIERVVIETQDKSQHSIAAKTVVNAAGPWASKLLEACGSHDYPVRPRY